MNILWVLETINQVRKWSKRYMYQHWKLQIDISTTHKHTKRDKSPKITEKIQAKELDMRTRLASLIVVKQEPLTNEYLESEQNALIGQTNYNEVDAQFYGLSDRHRDILPTQSIGDLNNNNSNYAQQDEFIEDKKCTYSRFTIYFGLGEFIGFLSCTVHMYIVRSQVFFPHSKYHFICCFHWLWDIR